MVRLILYRIALAIPILFVVTFLTFFLVSLIPGNAAIAILGQNATPTSIAALNKQLGLNQSIPAQYFHWIDHAIHGDFGVSLYSGENVSTLVSQRILPSLSIGVLATLIAAILGVATGMFAAVRGGWLARLLDAASLLGISLPNFWIALLLVVFVVGRLHMFPSFGYVAPTSSVSGWIDHLALPVAALAVAGVAMIAKQTRNAMCEALSRDFIRFMQANGISRQSLIFRHGLRYSAVPIISAVTATFINLFGGTVALEQVFAIPGLGSLVATAAVQHDLVVIQGAVLVYTLIILAATLIADVLYGVLDRRIKAAR